MPRTQGHHSRGEAQEHAYTARDQGAVAGTCQHCRGKHLHKCFFLTSSTTNFGVDKSIFKPNEILQEL